MKILPQADPGHVDVEKECAGVVGPDGVPGGPEVAVCHDGLGKSAGRIVDSYRPAEHVEGGVKRGRPLVGRGKELLLPVAGQGRGHSLLVPEQGEEGGRTAVKHFGKGAPGSKVS